MPEADDHALPGPTNDTWRTWLMTGARRAPADRRRMRGAHKGLKKMLLEGMSNGDERPHAWKDFSGAMIRHAVDEAMRNLEAQDKQVVKLAYFGGYSNRDIARETGLAEAAVQRRLRRALAAISEHIHRGRALGRRALYLFALWMSGRWLSDLTAHVAPAAAAAAMTVIVVAQPGPPAAFAPQQRSAPPVQAAAASSPHAVVPPLPSPTVVPTVVPAAPALPVPAPKLPVTLPSPPVHLPPLP